VSVTGWRASGNRLAGELQDPARHRHGIPSAASFTHERVEPFPGRFAWTDRRRTAQDLILLLQQPDRRFAARRSALSDLDVPDVRRRQCRLGGATSRASSGGSRSRWRSVPGSRPDRAPGYPHDVLTELLGKGLRHSNILPARPTGQAISDVTRRCSRPGFKTLKYCRPSPSASGPDSTPRRSARRSSSTTTTCTGTQASDCTPRRRSTTAPPRASVRIGERSSTRLRRHPERFVNQAPTPPRLPEASWINKPEQLAQIS